MSGTLYGADYVLSQKVWGIGASPVERSINRRTLHGFKPMLLIPPRDWDTDTIGGHGYARAEVRFAEPGQSLVARYADFAALSLAFRVVEQRRMFGKGKIRASSVIDPVHAAKMFAADMTCTKAALTIGGKHVTVLDIQEDLLDKAVVIAERVRLPQDEYEAIDVLRALNDALRQSNPERAEYATNARKWMDFAVRHQFLSKEVPPESVSAGDQTIMQRNLAWDRILPEGPGMRYWARLAERDPLVARIHEHADNFGTADRALARAAIIDSGMSLNYVKDWASYIHNEKVRSFGNPYGKR
jgi:hypothetical protein